MDTTNLRRRDAETLAGLLWTAGDIADHLGWRPERLHREISRSRERRRAGRPPGRYGDIPDPLQRSVAGVRVWWAPEVMTWASGLQLEPRGSREP